MTAVPTHSAPVYEFDVRSKPVLPVVTLPVVQANAQNLEGYGYLVDDPAHCQIEITQWPAQGWRPVDAGTGDEGGVTEGQFECWWQGDVLFAKNHAVGGSYVLGWTGSPDTVTIDNTAARRRDHVCLWHFNYHPDGGQMFFPRAKTPFVCPLALPGDDIHPDKVTAFWFDGTQGLYIHANIWHEGVFPSTTQASFEDRQGKVHARVSADFGAEFGCYLAAPLP